MTQKSCALNRMHVRLRYWVSLCAEFLRLLYVSRSDYSTIWDVLQFIINRCMAITSQADKLHSCIMQLMVMFSAVQVFTAVLPYTVFQCDFYCSSISYCFLDSQSSLHHDVCLSSDSIIERNDFVCWPGHGVSRSLGQAPRELTAHTGCVTCCTVSQ